MTEADFIDIEKRLDLKLPDYYKKFIISPQNEIISRDLHLEHLLIEKEQLIEINLLLKQNKGLSDNHFIVGHDGNGNYYQIELNDENEIVYFADHEEVITFEDTDEIDWKASLDPCWNNLTEFKDWLIEFHGFG